MERRALLRSVGVVGLGVLAAACGARNDAPRQPGTGDDAAPEPEPEPPEDVDPEPDESADRADPDPESATPEAQEPDPEPEPRAEAEDGSVRRVEVICREALGLSAAAAGASHRLDRLTLHHTGVELVSASRAPTHLRRHQKHHRNQGWPDIAYHYAVDLAGNVYELRDPSVPGDTFTAYDTAGHLQVVCEGDFGAQQPTDDLLRALSELFAGLATTHGLSPATLDTHRSYVPTTACPGDALVARLEEIRSAVVTLQQDPGVDLALQCGPGAEARVAAIEAG